MTQQTQPLKDNREASQYISVDEVKSLGTMGTASRITENGEVNISNLPDGLNVYVRRVYGNTWNRNNWETLNDAVTYANACIFEYL